jgi:hypothetical protein
MIPLGCSGGDLSAQSRSNARTTKSSPEEELLEKVGMAQCARANHLAIKV